MSKDEYLITDAPLKALTVFAKNVTETGLPYGRPAKRSIKIAVLP